MSTNLRVANKSDVGLFTIRSVNIENTFDELINKKRFFVASDELNDLFHSSSVRNELVKYVQTQGWEKLTDGSIQFVDFNLRNGDQELAETAVNVLWRDPNQADFSDEDLISRFGFAQAQLIWSEMLSRDGQWFQNQNMISKSNPDDEIISSIERSQIRLNQKSGHESQRPAVDILAHGKDSVWINSGDDKVLFDQSLVKYNNDNKNQPPVIASCLFDSGRKKYLCRNENMIPQKVSVSPPSENFELKSKKLSGPTLALRFDQVMRELIQKSETLSGRKPDPETGLFSTISKNPHSEFMLGFMKLKPQDGGYIVHGVSVKVDEWIQILSDQGKYEVDRDEVQELMNGFVDKIVRVIQINSISGSNVKTVMSKVYQGYHAPLESQGPSTAVAEDSDD